nr:hypothetical protein [Bacilli bacterium]
MIRKYKAYRILVEPNDDYYFSIEGICVIDDQQKYTLFTHASRHNFLRNSILKTPLPILFEDGIVLKGETIKLEDLEDFRSDHGLLDVPVSHLLHYLYTTNQKHYFFLERYLEE